MDLATLIGLVGAAVLVGASVMLGTSPEVFMNPTGLLLVVGGSLFVVLAKFSITQFKFALKAAAFPLFFWLPDSYPIVPLGVNGFFAGLRLFQGHDTTPSKKI